MAVDGSAAVVYERYGAFSESLMTSSMTRESGGEIATRMMSHPREHVWCLDFEMR